MVFVKGPLRIIVIVTGELGRSLPSRLPAAKRSFRCLARTLILELIGTAALLVQADGQVTQDAIVDAHSALQLRYFFARAFKLEIDKGALSLVQDFVGQLTATERLCLGDGAALISDDLLAGLG